MRRKKHDEEHENAERWLLTYADLITLLLAFFIMMYTFSKQDAQKYEEVASHLKSIFSGGTGIAVKGSPSATSIVHASSRGASAGEIKRQLESEVISLPANKDGGPNNISIFSDERGIVIRVMDRAFFEGGKADMKERARKTMDKIVPIIASSRNQIMIEGHTDDAPINTPEFRSNWELSVRRATEVVRYLVEHHNFPPDRISAVGYAQYRPVALNDSPENRAMNRRIEIIVMKSKEQDFATSADPSKVVITPK